MHSFHKKGLMSNPGVLHFGDIHTTFYGNANQPAKEFSIITRSIGR
jgi:hypothetical protein